MSGYRVRTVCLGVFASLSVSGCTDDPTAAVTTGPGAAASANSRAAVERPADLAFTGAVIIDGTGAAPVMDGVLLVSAGRIDAVGPASAVPIPPGASRIDLTGAYVVPGFVNVHGHVGVSDGLVGEPEAHTRENVSRQLERYARYGITTVVSLGDAGTETLPLRAAQQDAALARARVYTSGPVLAPATPEGAASIVASAADTGVDWIKIRIDDALGRAEKMTPEVYGTVIGAAHARNLPVAAHLVYLQDAKELVRRGADLLAHSVRDLPVDDELIGLMRERGVCLTPTLTRELSVFVYADRPDFFDDPFFAASADPAVVAALQTAERQMAVRDSEAARYFRDALPLAQRNVLALHEGDVRVVMGTDTGLVGRFQGYFEHVEMEMMQAAGMTPAAVLLAATAHAAACMRLPDVGTLTPGKWADFVVLDRDPLQDILATRSIREVRVAGNRVGP
jgi:imidazolonepropionase-like amidohydrolase